MKKNTKTNHRGDYHKPVKNQTTNYPMDRHKVFCKRCHAYNECCPKAGSHRLSGACTL